MNTIEKIKSFYIEEFKEDEFTKLVEYTSKPITFGTSRSINEYCASVASDLNICAGGVIRLHLIYRKKTELDLVLISVEALMIGLDKSPDLLKDLNIIFLLDNEPLELNNQTDHNYGLHKIVGGSDYTETEVALLKIGIDDLIQIVNAKSIKIRMTGYPGKLVEQKIEDDDLSKFKGFYNSIFDQDFETDYLLNIIQEVKKREAEKREAEKKPAEDPYTKGACFVISATMGNTNHPVVNDFRSFRDSYLTNNFVGKVFVKFYYIIGPYFAEIIKKNDTIRALVYRYIVQVIHKMIKK